jgi:hypothetical protein
VRSRRREDGGRGVLLFSRMEAGRDVEGERVEFIVLVEPRRLRLKLGRGDAIDMVYVGFVESAIGCMFVSFGWKMQVVDVKGQVHDRLTCAFVG